MEKETQFKVFVSSLLNSKGKDGEEFRKLYESIASKLPENTLIALKNTADIWMRDYMPIQIDRNTFVTYQYRPDYLSIPERHKFITDRFYTSSQIKNNIEISKNKEESQLPFYGPDVTIRECNLILDGGNIGVCGDKIILTDKVLIENRPKSHDQIIAELKRAFGKEVVIIPSDPYEIEYARKANELPLCHADGVLAPIDNETILIADYGKDPKGYVPQLMNVLSRYFKPENIKHFDFRENWTEDVWVYINFLRVGDLILIPEVEYEKKDDPLYIKKLKACNKEAKRQLKEFFGTDKIIGIDTTALSLGINKNGEYINDNNGGALHCISWEVKS